LITQYKERGMKDSKMAIERIDESDEPIAFKVIRGMIDLTQEERKRGPYSEAGWIDKERSKLKKGIRKRLREGHYILKYRDKGDRIWHDSARAFRGDSPKPQAMSFSIGLVRNPL
jgi:hypothetical protein|tara:strand:+ start:1645 stop:1989 length:345 start_codon:yes stop_codon:yes gene_type:complete